LTIVQPVSDPQSTAQSHIIAPEKHEHIEHHSALSPYNALDILDWVTGTANAQEKPALLDQIGVVSERKLIKQKVHIHVEQK